MPDRSRFRTAPPALPNWSRRFADPIPIPNGKSLFSLRDAAQYVLALPPAEQQATRWKTAATVLKMVAETGGNAMMARIGMMKALHHRAPGVAQTPRRKRVKSFSDHRLNRKNPGLLRTGVSFERSKVSGFYLITARLTNAGYYVASAPPSYASPAQAGSPVKRRRRSSLALVRVDPTTHHGARQEITARRRYRSPASGGPNPLCRS
jgi:hypothetical protein